jgi:putative hydrolase of the HAD superfamily
VLTNGDTRQQQTKLRHLGLTEDIPFLFTSSDAGATKPAPEIFHLACTRLNLAPADVAYVGDRLHTDAQAATDAGLYGIWLDRTNGPATTTLPRITTLDELPALLAARAFAR